MDVREKLVELIFDSLCRHIDKSCKLAENIADDLISDGVTVQENVEISDELLKQLKNAPITICKEEPSIELVQEWISVDDRLPEDDSDVLAYSRNGEEGRIYPANYAKGVWFDCIFTTPATDTTTHWMPLPLPPKGE